MDDDYSRIRVAAAAAASSVARAPSTRRLQKSSAVCPAAFVFAHFFRLPL